jgi:uncharacterized protein YlxP (DUF503 family)
MYLGVARFDLHLVCKPGSLKEKRAIVRRLRDRIRSRLEVSAAEVDAQDLHHRAVLGVACVSADPGVARSLLEAAEQVVDSEPRVEVLERELEVEAW